MELLNIKYGWLFALELHMLLLVTANISLANGQQVVGVSLILQGEVIPSNSLVDADDILYTTSNSQNPTNDRPNQHDSTLLCVTDLVDCCETEMLGNWYFPNGNLVTNTGDSSYRSNRGQNEVRNGRQFYGSVRLFRRRVPPVQNEGPYICVLPDRFNVDQTLNAYLVNFAYSHSDDHVTFSHSGSGTAGETYSLTCEAILVNPGLLPTGAPTPTFQWFFGPNGNGSLPSGLITPATTSRINTDHTKIYYNSTLQLSPLSQSHAGMYTCRIGAGRLVNSDVVAVNAPAISVQITTSGTPSVGQSSYSLICDVTGAENLNPSITYQWTKTNGTQTQIETNLKTLSFSRLLPSDAGLYSCNVVILSAYVSSVVNGSKSFEVTIIIPAPTAVSVHSNSPNPILSGSSPTLTCTVEMKSTVTVPMAVSMEWTGPDGTTIVPTTISEMISFTLYSSSHTLDSVEFADSGDYSCTVKIENEPKVYAHTSITIVDGVFQLRLKSVGLCQQWYSESCERSEEYSYFIKGALVKAIERHCKCRFPITNLLNEDLFLYDGSSNLMIYRNTLLGTLNFNGTQITGFIQDWVNTGPLIKIDENPVRVDSSCPTAISSLDEPVCGEEKCLFDNDPNYAMCAQHLANDDVASCFEGCVIRNG